MELFHHIAVSAVRRSVEVTGANTFRERAARVTLMIVCGFIH